MLDLQLFGGRGAASGISKDGKKYGTEYKAVLKDGNIKFVKQTDKEANAKAPLETMTKGRVYVTIVEDEGIEKLYSITYYDNKGLRTRQIDFAKSHDGELPHTHHGYYHNENDTEKGYAKMTEDERKMVDRVRKLWEDYTNKR